MFGLFIRNGPLGFYKWQLEHVFILKYINHLQLGFTNESVPFSNVYDFSCFCEMGILSKHSAFAIKIFNLICNDPFSRVVMSYYLRKFISICFWSQSNSSLQIPWNCLIISFFIRSCQYSFTIAKFHVEFTKALWWMYKLAAFLLRARFFMSEWNCRLLDFVYFLGLFLMHSISAINGRNQPFISTFKLQQAPFITDIAIAVLTFRADDSLDIAFNIYISMITILKRNAITCYQVKTVY